MAQKKSNFYLTREQLITEIILSKKKHRESNVPLSPAECFTPKLTEYLQLMVTRYANKGQWRGYSYIEDMKSDALLTLCQNAFKYDETRYDNPFGYYTQIIKYCFITFLEKEELVRDIKDSLWETIGMTPSYARQIKNEILDHAREAALDRAKARGEKEQVHKTLKSLKKDVEFINEKINRLARLIRLKEADIEADIEIAEILEVDQRPYTGDRDSAMSLFTRPPVYLVEADIEIAGQLVSCLTLADESTRSNTKRVIPDAEDATITAALCSIALTIRRDLLVKELRNVSGYNIASTRMPTADKTTDPEASEFEDTSYSEFAPSNPKRRPRRKTP